MEFMIQMSDRFSNIIPTGPNNLVQWSNLTTPVMEVFSGNEDYRQPLTDAAFTIFAHDKRRIERTFLLYIDERYVFRILDFTDHYLAKVSEKFSMDLMDVMAFWIKRYKVEEVYCNSLTMIAEDSIFVFPCSSGDTKFAIWIIVYRFEDKFNVNAFARTTTAMLIDKIGRNSIGAFYHHNLAFVATSSIEHQDTLRLAVFDLSHITSNFVVEKF